MKGSIINKLEVLGEVVIYAYGCEKFGVVELKCKEWKERKKGKGDRNSETWNQVMKEGMDEGGRSVEENRSSDIMGCFEEALVYFEESWKEEKAKEGQS